MNREAADGPHNPDNGGRKLEAGRRLPLGRTSFGLERNIREELGRSLLFGFLHPRRNPKPRSNRLIPTGLEFVGEFAATRLDNPAPHHHVNPIG